ncbi:MAG: GHKL domain-containing protein, partial [Deltaproteobacteria bacterium]|nr:GHKL domain-containing protein [Deltaproteobacteria bacterium]
LRTLPEDDPRREKLKIIADEANRLEHLLTEVRDFTRPPRPQPRETDLNGLVGEVLRMFEAQAAEQGIVCRMDSAEDIPVCRIDSNQIKQVLINLVKNAVEAMPDGGSLKVTTARDGQHLKVTVENSGEGIPPEVMKRIFHPFFSTKAKGTGLGLAVSYKLVQDHGGEIVVQNYEGQGARFTVSLPLEAKTD